MPLRRVKQKKRASQMYRLEERVQLADGLAPPGMVKKHHGRVATVKGFNDQEYCVLIQWDGSAKTEQWHKNYFEVIDPDLGTAA